VDRMKLRLYFEGGHSLGPGKVQLLEAVREHGSISAAARALGMAYRHAWVLIDDVNRCFGRPVLTTASGGRAGGGARLTPFGEEVVRRFRALERRAAGAIASDVRALEAGRGAPQKGVRRPARARGPGSGRIRKRSRPVR
jgi:molybdate transport system regulatory protein